MKEPIKSVIFYSVCLFFLLLMVRSKISNQPTNQSTNHHNYHLKFSSESRSHSDSEPPWVQLTRSFIITNKEKCANKTFDLILLVISEFQHVDRRNCFRQSTPSNVGLIFVLAKNAFIPQSLIDFESNLYGDIIQGDFVDSWRNLTYKTVFAFTWASLYCRSARFIAKTDDDTFINFHLLSKYLDYYFADNKLLKKRAIIGWDNLDNKPNRDESNKHYVDPAEYSEQFYPHYTIGALYILTIEVIDELLAHVPLARLCSMEDVFWTGVVREKSGKIGIHSIGDLYSFIDLNEAIKLLTNPTSGPYPYISSSFFSQNPCNVLLEYGKCIQNNCSCCYSDKMLPRVFDQPFNEITFKFDPYQS